MQDSATAKFRPTPASIPPPNAHLTLSTPHDLPVNFHPLNPLQFLLRAAQIYPDKLALAHPDVQYPVFYTYSVWAQRVQNFAYGLLEAGIQPGDRIAVLSPNSPMIAEALQGVIGARAIVTTINIRLRKHEMEYILSHCGAKLIFVDHEYRDLVADAKARIILCNDTGRAGDPYEDFLTAGRAYSHEKGWPGLEMDSDESKPLSLNYTSGTTGRPKGVLTTLRGVPCLCGLRYLELLISHVLAIFSGTYLASIANAFETQMTKESTYLWVLPMFHAAGWTFPWSITFSFATQVILRSIDYSLIWKHFLNSGVTHYCGAPTVQIGITNHPGAKQLAHPIKTIIAGAAPTAHLLAQLESKGFQPVHVYGLTETYGPFTRNYPQPSWIALPSFERAQLSARQGYAFATSFPLRVVHPTKSPGEELVDVPRDGKTIGEIVLRGNIVMQGYFQDPDATARAFDGGYFHSGDLAVWHPDGSVQIQDRIKDIIISGGENASTLAIEQELASHPDVLEVSVVGCEHPTWGERPMAFVVLHAEPVRHWAGKHLEFSSALKAHARERLPGFATPEWVVIVEELPKTSTGKIMKTILRKRANTAKL
ncbi:acetyl-CoA synthetase-like protein [Russula compacta]|nr:acetyl-CoA synthetase-like protein [Russula compacta]